MRKNKVVKIRLMVILALFVVILQGNNLANAEQVTGLKGKLLEYYSSDMITKVDLISTLGVVQGSDKGLELERGLNRVEGAVIYGRLLGTHEIARTNNDVGTKFSDIPKWAEKDISYLYEKGKIFGVNETEFGSNQPMSAEQFTTLVLRGLGYSDKTGDFSWDKSLDKAVEIGLIDETTRENIEKEKLFTREEMLIISYNALFTENKGTRKLLMQERVSDLKHKDITKVAYKKLSEKETKELEKVKNNPKLELFSSDTSGKADFYSKIYENIVESAKLLNIYLEGDYYNLYEDRLAKSSVKSVEVRGRTLVARLNTGTMIFLSVNDDIVVSNSDQEFIKYILSGMAVDIIGDKKYKQNSILVAEKVYDTGKIDVDIYDNSNETYKETLRTKEIKFEDLEINLEYIKLDINKFDKDYYWPK